MPKVLSIRSLWLAVCLMGAAGCTVHQTEAPAVTGPSEFALSVGVTATPDAISQDGGSQSQIVVTARGPNGEGMSGVMFRLDMFVQGQAADYGTLSGKSVVTGSDGRATAVYTAPPPLPAGTNLQACSPNLFSPNLPGGCILIAATPVGSSFVANSTRNVEIHLIPLGVIAPPAATPTAQFTFTPTAPTANTAVQFDATASCAGQSSGGGCSASSGSITSYAWDFGDGSAGSGKVGSHSYSVAGTFIVTLTVTNDRGVAASSTQAVSVGGGLAPTADFVFSPTPAVVNGQVYFDANASKAGIGHHLVGYKWNWGDGDEPVTVSAPTQQHDFLLAGSYQVTLTVVDESGQEGTTTKSVVVGTGAPVVSFITAVTNAATHTIQADAGATTAMGGATIATYDWSWGDGNSTAGAAVQSHAYAAAGTYTVKLTVTDSLGRAAVGTLSVTVL